MLLNDQRSASGNDGINQDCMSKDLVKNHGFAGMLRQGAIA
jgi:hypothetical protein